MDSIALHGRERYATVLVQYGMDPAHEGEVMTYEQVATVNWLKEHCRKNEYTFPFKLRFLCDLRYVTRDECERIIASVFATANPDACPSQFFMLAPEFADFCSTRMAYRTSLAVAGYEPSNTTGKRIDCEQLDELHCLAASAYHVMPREYQILAFRGLLDTDEAHLLIESVRNTHFHLL